MRTNGTNRVLRPPDLLALATAAPPPACVAYLGSPATSRRAAKLAAASRSWTAAPTRSAAAAAAGGWYLSRTSLMAIPAHGRLGLQSNLTAVAVADVPSTSVYDTPLISIPDP